MHHAERDAYSFESLAVMGSQSSMSLPAKLLWLNSSLAIYLVAVGTVIYFCSSIGDTTVRTILLVSASIGQLYLGVLLYAAYLHFSMPIEVRQLMNRHRYDLAYRSSWQEYEPSEERRSFDERLRRYVTKSQMTEADSDSQPAEHDVFWGESCDATPHEPRAPAYFRALLKRMQIHRYS